MKTLSFILISLIILITCEDDFPLENNVIILTDATFEKAVKKYDYLMVLFYAPWCGHCKKFHPEYEKAAATLRKENLYLAKVDATTEKQLAEKYNIEGFPTVKLLIKGEEVEYTGGRTENEVVNWMRKKTGPPCIELKNENDIEKFQKDNEVCLIYYGNKKNEIDEYTNVARKNEDYNFGIVSDENLIKKYGKVSNVILYKKFDEKKNEYSGEITQKNLEDFVNKYSTQKVMNFDEKAAQIIFGKGYPAIILYASEKSEKYSEYGKILKTLSEKLQGKLKVVLTDIKEGMAERLAEFIGIKDEDLPSVRIADTRNNDFKKYNMKDEINLENIIKFVNDWENKRLKPSLKSEDEPKENNGNVFVVVGKTFEKEVINNDKDVLLLFYAPWCGHCKEFHPKFEEAARILKKDNPKLLFAKMDATENEVESVNIEGYPTIKFYPGNKKDKEPIDFNEQRSIPGILKFLREHTTNKLVVDKEIEKKEKEGIKKKKDDDSTQDL